MDIHYICAPCNTWQFCSWKHNQFLHLVTVKTSSRQTRTNIYYILAPSNSLRSALEIYATFSPWRSKYIFAMEIDEDTYSLHIHFCHGDKKTFSHRHGDRNTISPWMYIHIFIFAMEIERHFRTWTIRCEEMLCSRQPQTHIYTTFSPLQIIIFSALEIFATISPWRWKYNFAMEIEIHVRTGTVRCEEMPYANTADINGCPRMLLTVLRVSVAPCSIHFALKKESNIIHGHTRLPNDAVNRVKGLSGCVYF